MPNAVNQGSLLGSHHWAFLISGILGPKVVLTFLLQTPSANFSPSQLLSAKLSFLCSTTSILLSGTRAKVWHKNLTHFNELPFLWVPVPSSPGCLSSPIPVKAFKSTTRFLVVLKENVFFYKVKWNSVDEQFYNRQSVAMRQ